jgi:hypothetical protein
MLRYLKEESSNPLKEVDEAKFLFQVCPSPILLVCVVPLRRPNQQNQAFEVIRPLPNIGR